MKIAVSFIMFGLAVSASGEIDLSKLPPPSTQKGLTYEKNIKPILQASCFGCHGEQRQRGGLRLDSLENLMAGGEDGEIVKPGNGKESLLVHAVSQLDPEIAMPPKRGPGGMGGGPGVILAPQMMGQGDKNDDKKLTKAELTDLAESWYDQMDRDQAGKLNKDEFGERFGELLPAPRGRRAGDPDGDVLGGGVFDASDANKDASLTKEEMKGAFGKWYDQWDKTRTGFVTEKQISDGLATALPRSSFGGPGGQPSPGGAGPGRQRGPGAPPGGAGPGGPRGPGATPGTGPGAQRAPGGGPGGPQPKPLTAQQVGLVRAWIDQGAK